MNISDMYLSWLSARLCDQPTIHRIARFATNTGDRQLIAALLAEYPASLSEAMIDTVLAANNPHPISCFLQADDPYVIPWIATAPADVLRTAFSYDIGHKQWGGKVVTALFRRREPDLKFLAILNTHFTHRLGQKARERRAAWLVKGWPFDGKLGMTTSEALERLSANSDATALVMSNLSHPFLAIDIADVATANRTTHNAQSALRVIRQWSLTTANSTDDLDTNRRVAEWLIRRAGDVSCADGIEETTDAFLAAVSAMPSVAGSSLDALRGMVAYRDAVRAEREQLVLSAHSDASVMLDAAVIGDPRERDRILALAANPALSIEQAVTLLEADHAPDGLTKAMFTGRDPVWLGGVATAMAARAARESTYKSVLRFMVPSDQSDWVLAHVINDTNELQRVIRDGLADANLVAAVPLATLNKRSLDDRQIRQATHELVLRTLGNDDDAWAVLENVVPTDETTLTGFLEVATAIAAAK